MKMYDILLRRMSILKTCLKINLLIC